MRSTLLTITLLLLAPAAWGAPIDDAEALARGGKYAEAEAALGKLKGAPRAQLALARVQLEQGRYAEAVKTARAVARGKEKAAALTVAGEALRLSGQLPAAEKTLREAIAASGKYYRAHAFLGIVLHEQGKAADAKTVFDRFYDDFAADKIDKKSAEQLTYVAMACRYTDNSKDNFKDAYDTYSDATKADAKHLEAWLELAEISLEKYEAGHAEQHYGKALALNPNRVEALLGLAKVKLEQSNDVEEARKLIERAEKVSPQSVDAAALRAHMLVDAEEFAPAEALLAQALQRNPNHLWALSVLGASQFLRDDGKAFERTRDRVLKLNPRYTRFFHDVVSLGVRQHRYAESIELSKQAIKIDPEDWYSLADLGTNYLRMGEDAKGLDFLRKAWKGDPFNVQNFNLLNLFEDVLAKEYTFFDSKHFRLRVHKEYVAKMRRVVVPLLEKAYGIYQKKYRFTPKGPIVIELFNDPEQYAVRTVGLPGLSAIGVCFGRVITSTNPFLRTSPSRDYFNWGQVLWHELNHIFTIQMSRSRVPRWLTEGFAELEPPLARAEWKRENDFDMFRALKAGRVKGFAAMNTAFTQAKSMAEMVVAYYQGSRQVDFLIKGWGMDRIVGTLAAYGQGKRTEQILPAATGVPLAELDRRFREGELKRLALYGRNWIVDLGAYGDLPAREKVAAARPQDAVAQAELAIAQLRAGKVKEADAQAQKALALDGKQRLALFAAAQGARARNDAATVEKLLRRLIAAGGDSFDVRFELGSLALARNDSREAQTQLEAAKRLDPESYKPYLALARVYKKTGQKDRLIAELKGWLGLEQQSYPLVEQLLELLAEKKDYAGLRSYGQMGYYINPGSIRLHQLLAEALSAPAPRPELDRAVWHLETALLLEPEKPAPLHVQLARVHLQRKDRGKARAAVQKALKADPGSAEAKALQQQL